MKSEATKRRRLGFMHRLPVRCVPFRKPLKHGDDEMRNSRTINIGRAPTSAKNTTEARFYVALVPGAAGATEVADVKFISGDEKLKPMAGLLKSARYGF